MAKATTTPEPDAPAAGAEPEVFEQTVDEFCADLSARDRRPELIYAFACDERAAGRIRDLPDNFLSRFNDFAKRPA